MRLTLKCRTPYCKNLLYVSSRPKPKDYLFCDACKKEHSYSVLVVQADLKMPIKEALMEARVFKNASGIGDFLGVSFVSVYHWIRKYYGMSFQEFRRQYICRSRKCYLLNIENSSYSRNDYVLKKIRARHFCACINALQKNFIMTNAPSSVVSSILRGSPKVVRLSDEIFSITPKPIRFKMVCPVYFRQYL
jgi:hypothetical protein